MYVIIKKARYNNNNNCFLGVIGVIRPMFVLVILDDIR